MLEIKTHSKGRSSLKAKQCLLSLCMRLKGDLDNYAKPLIDCFVQLGMIEDDRSIQTLVITRPALLTPYFFIIEFDDEEKSYWQRASELVGVVHSKDGDCTN